MRCRGQAGAWRWRALSSRTVEASRVAEVSTVAGSSRTGPRLRWLGRSHGGNTNGRRLAGGEELRSSSYPSKVQCRRGCHPFPSPPKGRSSRGRVVGKGGAVAGGGLAVGRVLSSRTVESPRVTEVARCAGSPKRTIFPVGWVVGHGGVLPWRGDWSRGRDASSHPVEGPGSLRSLPPFAPPIARPPSGGRVVAIEALSRTGGLVAARPRPGRLGRCRHTCSGGNPRRDRCGDDGDDKPGELAVTACDIVTSPELSFRWCRTMQTLWFPRSHFNLPAPGRHRQTESEQSRPLRATHVEL